MSFRKIAQAELEGKGNLGRPDTPGVTTAEMQRILDELPREVIVPAFNELSGQMDELAGDTYTKAETDVAIDRKAVELGAGDMAQAIYDPQHRREDVFALIDRATSRIYTAELPAARQFFYKSGAESGLEARPAAGDPLPEGFTAYSADMGIPGTNGTPLYVQVVKASEGRVLAWGEAQATPAAGEATAPVQTEGSELEVPLTAGDGTVTLAAMAADPIGWQAQADGSYTQTVECMGMTETVQVWDWRGAANGNIETDLAVQEALGYITRIDSAEGCITVVCGDSCPEIPFVLAVLDVR